MQRALDVFEQRADVVETEAGRERTQVSCLYDETRPSPAWQTRSQAPPKGLVDDLFERLARATRLCPKFGRHVGWAAFSVPLRRVAWLSSSRRT